MDNLKKAKRIQRQFNKKIEDLTWKARTGDNSASLDVLKVITDYEKKLHATGYRTSDEDCEDDENAKLIPITEEWREEQRQKQKRMKDAEDEMLRCLHEKPMNKDKATAAMHAFLNCR